MKIGFIGAGNMGGAIAKAVAKSSCAPEIWIADSCADKAKELAREICAAAADNAAVIDRCDYVFLGVKPQVLGGVLQSIASMSEVKQPVFISMAAGVTIDTICNTLGTDAKVIRIMPNTPVSVGAGMILYACSDRVTAEEEKNFLKIMEQAGEVDQLAENLIDAASAVSGCGPAFAFLIAEALADGGVACGLPRDKARKYAAQMLYGSAELLRKSEKCPGDLKDAVCSPGGSTIQGIQKLEENGVRGAFIDAVVAAFERTKELG